MRAIVTIIAYAVATLISFLLVKKDYKKAKKAELYNCRDKRSIPTIIIIAFLYTFFTLLAVNISQATSGDRFIYSQVFNGNRETPSLGLSFVVGILGAFTSDPNVLFCTCTAIVVILTLIAYKYSSSLTPNSLLFLLLTQYVLFTIPAMKQGFANGFGVLCIILALEHKDYKDTIASIACIIIAILFHHTGYLLIPIYCLLRLKNKNKGTVAISIIAISVLILFFEPIMTELSKVFVNIAPMISVKIDQYILDSSSLLFQESTFSTIIKGIPFFIITICGVFMRNNLRNKIDGYDNYLILCFILSAVYIATFYNTWLYRFAYYLYLPVGGLFSLMLDDIDDRRKKLLFCSTTIAAIAVITIRFIALMYLNSGGF